jgi:hypothetical protein
MLWQRKSNGMNRTFSVPGLIINSGKCFGKHRPRQLACFVPTVPKTGEPAPLPVFYAADEKSNMLGRREEKRLRE